MEQDARQDGGGPTPVTGGAPATEVERALAWDFPGWGTAERIDDLEAGPTEISHLDSGQAHKLGPWRSTAICGNDITSSCLYVTAIASFYAGPYAPLALALVAAVLFLFRKIYAEVGTALPLNGGAYNVLLNTTGKGQASLAACLTIISYIATAVLSADSAMHYAHNLLPALDVYKATFVLLGLFAVLNIVGIGESAGVALAIFGFHILTLVALVLLVGGAAWGHGGTFLANWHTPTPHGIGHALFFGFAAAMLGISGFESSANFIEEQKPGVFPLTLRNMWLAVAVFNPVISLLSMAVLSLPQITAHQADLLAEMGRVSVGPWLQKAVSIDATLVLSGAVLTSYVGVTGLMRRMSLDRCLPQTLLAENKLRRTNHWIILLFFAMCSSILLITAGKLETLAGVYTIAFLGVMSLFAVGNILLKVKRGRLPRSVRAPWPSVLVALGAVLAALVGNILIDPKFVQVFFLYLIVAVGVVTLMFQRLNILRFVLIAVEQGAERLGHTSDRVVPWLLARIQKINTQEVLFFAEDESLWLLNRAALYVLENEQNKHLKIVHCYQSEADIPSDLGRNISVVDHIYPELRIDTLLVKGTFGPPLIERLSKRLGVPKNYMFIGTPSDRFPHSLADLGGVRLVM